MTAKKPGSLGSLSFGANGTVTSNDYSPRRNSKSATLFCYGPTRPGTVRYGLRRGPKIIYLTAATAVAQDGFHTHTIELPISGLYTAFVEFTNNNGQAGSVDFDATDDA